MTTRSFPLAAALATGLVIAVAVSADAQGNGNGNGRPKHRNRRRPPRAPTTSALTSSSQPSAPTASVSSSSTSTPITDGGTDPSVSIVTFRQFGSWLDDASAGTPGEGYVSIGVGYWRLSGMSQINMPMLGAGVGVTDRMQLSATVPFYNVRAKARRGLDDIYLGASDTLIDPTLTIGEFGLAVSPVMEVLSPGLPEGACISQFPSAWNCGGRRSAYGSAGYFTRGSVFTGGALGGCRHREWFSPAHSPSHIR